MIVLPKEKLKARIENPRFLILFGKPKSGKTTLASKLDNNLIVDLEGGSEFLEALAIQARSVNDLGEKLKKKVRNPISILLLIMHQDQKRCA